MELSLKIDQQKSQLDQVAEQLGVQVEGDMVRLPKTYGDGYLRSISLPGGLQLNHYHFLLRQPIKLHSFVPKDGETYLINVNLSEDSFKKDLIGEPAEIGKILPMGCFFYSPGVESYGNSPINIPFDIIIITFPTSFLDFYITESSPEDGFSRFISGSPKFCVFEDLDYGQEGILREVLSHEDPGALDKLQMHTDILRFLLSVLTKVGQRSEGSSALHPDDLQKLFMISAILKSHLHGSPPSIDELAREAGMSASKLKRGFKQVFGIPPYQYYLKAKMGEARKLLQSRSYAISEIGHILGYSNLSKFSQAFKKEFGMTPRQYRGTIGS